MDLFYDCLQKRLLEKEEYEDYSTGRAYADFKEGIDQILQESNIEKDS
jgi:hypothetical protein